MYNPISTYRFQFNKDFTLKDAEKLIPYLLISGIKTVYASPVFEAVKGSTHGYDVTNPLKINPEIGTEQDFENLIEKLHENEIGWVQDIVPNHMAFSSENPWIYDILICVNVQHEPVFDVTHKLIATWIRKGLIDGLRIDHIDGLFNPGEYLKRLRKLVGEGTYILVEKILEKEEKLPESWPVEGSTGYDFLGMVNNLLTNPEKGPFFYEYYNEWIDKTDDFDDVFYKKNSFILHNRLKGELDNLTRECAALETVSKLNVDTSALESAIGEFLVFCPIYKIYSSPSQFSEFEKKLVTEIIRKAREKNPQIEQPLNLLHDLFLLRLPVTEKERTEIDRFFRHCMQFTGPLMAKGIEDTAFYSYNPFIGHNEVGDSPGYFGIRTETFHNYMKERLVKMPLTMNTISTHDTKRGEDARARLNVLSDVPETWMSATKEWHELNHEFKQFDDGKETPTPNDEYLIYQVLCAHVPMDAKIDQSFKERLEEYLVKAMREAKVNSSWSNPDEFYENETVEFVRKILSPQAEFPKSFIRFMEEIIPHGIANSITQQILKNTVPGVPDTFRGTETWNLSFVDPDNRRAVDFEKLSVDLDRIIKNYNADAIKLAGSLWSQALDGQLKQWISCLTLHERARYPELFLKGDYTPLEVSGKYKKHSIAFCRNYSDEHLIVVLPMNTASLPATSNWEDTYVELPAALPLHWENRLTKIRFQVSERLELSEVFGVIPYGFLRNVQG